MVFAREAPGQYVIRFRNRRSRNEKYWGPTLRRGDKKHTHLSGNACSTVGISTPEIAL